jgi:ADP-dependent NAD(P)H-hydrate dehydratase / NAD(P)H-hydrate epimerase
VRFSRRSARRCGVIPNYREGMSPLWTPAEASAWIAEPGIEDDKYSRGVLGVVTGSAQYPGAAVLGVEAALRTGVGMVRYLGPSPASTLVLQRRPEAVTSTGRVQAWLLGSGMDHDRVWAGSGASAARARLAAAIGQGLPTVLDGGALDLYSVAAGPVVITPHYRELARALGAEAGDISRDPRAAAVGAASSLGVTVLLKGHTTWVASPTGLVLEVASAPSWLATAGAGDALGGILGALVATHAGAIGAEGADVDVLARLAATASVIHGLAATRASAGGPLTILDLCAAIPATIAELLAAPSP